jgi:hypothetical protein
MEHLDPITDQLLERINEQHNKIRESDLRDLFSETLKKGQERLVEWTRATRECPRKAEYDGTEDRDLDRALKALEIATTCPCHQHDFSYQKLETHRSSIHFWLYLLMERPLYFKRAVHHFRTVDRQLTLLLRNLPYASADRSVEDWRRASRLLVDTGFSIESFAPEEETYARIVRDIYDPRASLFSYFVEVVSLMTRETSPRENSCARKLSIHQKGPSPKVKSLDWHSQEMLKRVASDVIESLFPNFQPSSSDLMKETVHQSLRKNGELLRECFASDETTCPRGQARSDLKDMATGDSSMFIGTLGCFIDVLLECQCGDSHRHIRKQLNEPIIRERVIRERERLILDCCESGDGDSVTEYISYCLEQLGTSLLVESPDLLLNLIKRQLSPRIRFSSPVRAIECLLSNGYHLDIELLRRAVSESELHESDRRALDLFLVFSSIWLEAA